MPQFETFLVVKPVHPQGVLIGDFSYIINGAAKPVLLKLRDQVDLEHVEFAKYARSATLGAMASLEKGGTVTRVMAEVSEKTYDALRNAFGLVEKPSKSGPYQHATRVVTIEPGLQVAVGGGAPAAQALPAETLVSGPQVQDSPAGEASQVGPREAVVEEAPAASVEEPPVITDWKSGKTLAEQEKFIKESTDKEFLAGVMNDKEETKKTQRLAKARLTEIE